MSHPASPSPSRPHAAWRFWDNPIFRRYCRSRLRPRGLVVSMLITVLIAGFLFAITRSAAEYRAHLTAADAERAPLIPLLIFQGLILFVLGTAQVSGGMVAERDEGVIDYQRLIPMTPVAKVIGYLFGLPIREYVMVFATLPFTGWCLWKGDVATSTWLPLYTVFFTSTLLYHFTGLLTGTVVKNRRWAFLVSIGLVFCLYTVVPQMARFGLVFFKYLTITPVLEEGMPYLLPKPVGAVIEVGKLLAPTVKFFNLDFSETVFTVFSQSSLILTFLIMLTRRWKRAESHLLGKIWAVVFFIWIQILLLGNALPLVESGKLFPFRGVARFLSVAHPTDDWRPSAVETVGMSGLYGCVTLILLFILSGLITPSPEGQERGWRRARKQGGNSLAPLSDPATGFWFTIVMAVAGAGGWYLFTRGLVESRWFPGHTVPLPVLGYFAVVMLAVGIAFQTLLESRGSRFMGLAVILGGITPVLVGAVLSTISNGLGTAAAWVIAISPASLPLYASGSLLSIAELPVGISRAVPRAFHFWLLVMTIVAVWQAFRLAATRAAMARQVLGNETGSTEAEQEPS
ncbi:MAG: hypothetical protein QM755_17190 [Luteolibacter sp.]